MSNCTLTGEYALFQKTHKFNVEEMLRLIDYGFSGMAAMTPPPSSPSLLQNNTSTSAKRSADVPPPPRAAAFMQATHKRRLRGEVLHSCLQILHDVRFRTGVVFAVSLHA